MRKLLSVFTIFVSMTLFCGCSNENNIVSTKVTGVTLDKEVLNLNCGENSLLIATVFPNNAIDKTLTWSSSNLEVATVENGLVNAITVGTSTITVTTNDGHFTDTCTVNVTQSIEQISVNFVTIGSYHVHASVDKTEAKIGDDITLTIDSVDDGYELDGFDLFDSKSNKIDYTGVVGSSNKYIYKQTFDGYCKMDIHVNGIVIKGFISDEHQLIDTNPLMSIDNGLNFSPVSIAGKEEGRDYYNFIYGSIIKFNLKDNEEFKAIGLKVDGVLHLVDEYGYVTFNAVIDDFDYLFLDIKVVSENLKPISGEYEFSIINSSHITLKTYKDDKKTEICGSNQNDIVYINAVSNDSNYSVREILVTAPTSDVSSPVKTMVSFVSDGWYSFKTPFSYSKIVTIRVIEANNTILQDSKAVGKYACVSIAPATRSFDSFNEQSVIISKDGTFAMKYNESSIKNDIFIADDGNYLTLEGTSSYKIPYGENFLFFCTDGDNGIKSPFGTYNTLCVKLENEEDDISMYSVHGERFAVDDKYFVSITIEKEGKNYANAFIDLNNKTYYFGVSYNVLIGEQVNDSITLYEVCNNSGEKIMVIGSIGTGGCLSRCIMGKHYGEYVFDSHTLIISNNNNAIFDNESYSYTIDEDSITLTSATREIVLLLDAKLRTFSITSDKQISLELPEFAGKKFRSGQYSIEDDIAYYGFYIEFSATEMKMSTAGGSDQNLDMEHHQTQTFGVNENVSYTYDSASQIVTTTIMIKGGSTKVVKFTYKNGAFYVQAKDLGSSFYSANIKLSEVK